MPLNKAPSPFSTPHVEQCRKIRAQFLVSFSMGVTDHMVGRGVNALDQVTEKLQEIVTSLRLIAGQNKSEQNDGESINSSQGEETRTVTERYHTEGRSLQRCNLCGKPRKKHMVR